MKACPVCSTEYADDVRFCKNDGSALRALGPAADLVGQVIAERYHVLRKLGEGGMGQVFLAEHVKMGRRSAIKVMNPAMVHDPDALARFNREAANASRITHPHVCAIYDFGETPDGLVYLAMEFVPGEPLTALLDREGALPLERAGRIFLQAADALQAAHDLGIVHRDLKPDNVMIAPGRSGDDVVKVVDFGIAKVVGGDASQRVTQTGLVVGTPEFMSPEQLSGDGVDGRSDLYSLALVLFRMVTGRLPFEADTVQETMLKRLTDEPLTLAEARRGLRAPVALQTCFDTAFSRAPNERYQTVGQFASDVAGALGLGQSRRSAQPAATQRLDAETAVLAPTRPAVRVRAGAPAASRRTAVLVSAALLLGAGTAYLLSHRPPAAVKPLPAQTASEAPAGGTPRSVVSTIDPTRAAAALDGLFDALTDTLSRSAATLRAARDSARRIFDAPGVRTDDRAFAAYVVANAYAALDDRHGACDWAQRATAVRATVAAYSALERALCGG